MSSATEETDLISPLKARLVDIEKRRKEENARHAEALQSLDEEVDAIEAVIELEEKRAGNGHVRKGPLVPGARTEMESEILLLLKDHRHVWPLNAIKMHLIYKGHGVEDDPNFGRSVHAVLLGLSKRDLIASKGDGQWQGLPPVRRA